jgi:hypothetical protein
MELSKAKVVPGFVIGRILFLDGGRMSGFMEVVAVNEGSNFKVGSNVYVPDLDIWPYAVPEYKVRQSNNLAPMKKVTEYDAPISDKGSYPDISKGEQYHVCIEENRIRFAV